MGYFDVPRGLSDADQEWAGLEAMGRRLARLRAKGVCSHGWIMAKPGEPVRCLEAGCGSTWSTDDEWYRARRAVIGGAS